MPQRRQHVSQAGRNREFSNFLQTDGTFAADWQVVALFYAALHYVDAYLATVGEHPTSHQERINHFDANLRPISSRYQVLQAYSRRARYDCKRYGSPQIRQLRNHLDAIESHVRSILPEN